jgi:methyl-accepting chemotaxis protein
MSTAPMTKVSTRRKPWRSRNVDPAILGLVSVNAAAALFLASQGTQMAVAGPVAAGCLGLAALVYWLARGKLPARLGMSLALGGLVALQIHLTRGQIEAHFNVFVTLGLLLAWRDWRPVAMLTAFFAVHHIAFDRLLAAGWPTYCLSQPDPVRVAVHVAFAAVMGLGLMRVAYVQGRDTEEALELEFLVNAMGREGAVRLNFNVVRVHSPAAQRLRQVQERMAQSVSRMHDAAECIKMVAEHAAAGSTELLDRTESTAGGLKDAATCLDQISVILQNSTNASDEAKGLSGRATAMAGDGHRMVDDVVATMKEIEADSRRIGDIVGVIDGIAFQTNILALNAAVEAARAGEQGRGFAVVASEVRHLARRSAEAAKEIRTVVASSSSTVQRGAGLVASAGDRMQELVDTVRVVGGLFDSITNDATDHAQGLQMVTESVDSLGEMTHNNQLLAQRTGATAQVLQTQVDRLTEVLGLFQLGGRAENTAAIEELRLALEEARRAHESNSNGLCKPTAAGEAQVEFF